MEQIHASKEWYFGPNYRSASGIAKEGVPNSHMARFGRFHIKGNTIHWDLSSATQNQFMHIVEGFGFNIIKTTKTVTW
jgi:hypothetical protein